MPLRSIIPELSRVRTLMAAVVLALGVSVAVQVVPPSTLARLDKTAFGAVTSDVVKPVIASVKVKVTVAVSPIFNAVSLIVIADASAGRTVSTVTES